MTTTTNPDSVEAPAWYIRAEQPVDLDQIHDLHREAFHGPAEAELVDAIRSGPDFIPELSLVAVTEDGSVLGHILVSRIEFQPADGVDRLGVLALAPLAVLPSHADSGIGSALTKGALALADEREEPLMAVLGPSSFYGRFGFVPASDFDIGGPYAEAGPAFQVRPRPGTTPPAGTVIYPPAFAPA